MKNLSLLFLLVLLTFGCKDEPTVCDIPKDTIPSWMDVIIEDLEASVVYEYSYINSAEYESQQVFILKNCCPFCGSVYIVYACDGTQIGTLGEDDINANDVKNEKYFWAPLGNQCTRID